MTLTSGIPNSLYDSHTSSTELTSPSRLDFVLVSSTTQRLLRARRQLQLPRFNFQLFSKQNHSDPHPKQDSFLNPMIPNIPVLSLPGRMNKAKEKVTVLEKENHEGRNK